MKKSRTLSENHPAYGSLFLKTLFCVFVSTQTPLALAEEISAIGYLSLPEAERLDLKQSGKSEPVLRAGVKGEVWHEKEQYRRALRKITLFSQPTKKSKVLASVDVSGALHELVTGSSPGPHRFASPKEEEYEKGKRLVWVYEKQGTWVKVRFRDQKPHNGRYAWLQLGPNSGGFVGFK